MNPLRCVIIFACILNVILPQCNAKRRKRTRYLSSVTGNESKRKSSKTPYFIKKIAKKNKKLATKLQYLEYQSQKKIDQSKKHVNNLKKELKVKKKALEKEKEKQIRLAKKKHEKAFKIELKKLSQKTKERLLSIKKDTEEQVKLIAKRTEETAFNEIKQAEIEIIEKYLGKKEPNESNKNLDKWKKRKTEELNDTFSYIGPILKSDKELHDLLQRKKIGLEAKITGTKKIDDQNYKEAVAELKPLISIHNAQKRGDKLVSEKLATMDVSEKDRTEIRFIIFSELQPLVKQSVSTEKHIPQDKLYALVTQAINEVIVQRTQGVAHHHGVAHPQGVAQHWETALHAQLKDLKIEIEELKIKTKIEDKKSSNLGEKFDAIQTQLGGKS